MFKTILKVIGMIILVVLLIFTGLFLYASVRPAAPGNYTKKAETGGDIEAAYLSEGSYATAYITAEAEEPMKKYTIYYPSELKSTDKVYPAVIMVNGTGIPASKYKSVLKHLASWGFVVIGNEDPSSGTGNSTDLTLLYLFSENENTDGVFYHKIDTGKIGLEGHSQGGAGVFSALTIAKYGDLYKTAVALSPTHEETAIALGWPYELGKINVPVMMLAGTEGDFETQLVLPIEAMNTMYDKIPSGKVMARRIGAEHGQMLYSADGYATAWFMWQLQGDEEAAKAFTGSNPELLNNPLYQDQKISLPLQQ